MQTFNQQYHGMQSKKNMKTKRTLSFTAELAKIQFIASGCCIGQAVNIV